MLFTLSPGRLRHACVVSLAGICLLTAAVLGSVFVNTARDGWAAIDAAGPAEPADGILLMIGLAGACLSLWLGLGLTLSALAALPGALGHLCGRLADQVAPAAVRKVVALVLGTTLTAAFVPGTALAGNGHRAPRPPVVGAATHVTSGLTDAAPDPSFRFVSVQPSRNLKGGHPEGADLRDAAPPPVWSAKSLNRPASTRRPASSGSPAQRVVVVRRGDTLWSIAARHLGPGATEAEIDAEWRRWHVSNRDVIGDDADLILPGQLLSVPASSQAGT